MNTQSTGSDTSLQSDPLSPVKPLLSARALERRRLLLKGASGSVATVAALQPLGALAETQSTVLTCMGVTGKEGLCTVSGVQSAAHSFGPNVNRITAKGKQMSWWSSKTNGLPTNAWPTSVSTTCTPSKTVGSLFVGCANSTATMMYILRNAPGSVEADYVCAYLNAGAMYSPTPSLAMCFPYSPSQVKAFWDAGGVMRTNAQALFKAIATA